MKTLEEIKFGWLKDPVDSRDFPARSLVYAALPLPKTYWCNPNTPVYNQGSTPSCVGYASAGVKTDEEFIQHGEEYTFDGLWLYKKCKKVDGIPNQAGSYPRIALKILQEMGIRQNTIPCKKTKPDSFWKIKAYYRVTEEDTDETIKQIIFQYGSLLIGSTWYSSWNSVKEVFPDPGNAISGGHAYRVCGWNEVGWVVVNSWGKLLWGIKGMATMPYDMFRSKVIFGDVWKIIDNQ